MIEEAYKIALARANRGCYKKGARLTRALADDNLLLGHYIGVMGELAFQLSFKIPMDKATREMGDGGIDFVLPYGQTVDVKTLRKPMSLLREAGKRHANILVLAHYTDENTLPILLGWQWDEIIITYPIGRVKNGRVDNHMVPRNELISMESLRYLIELGGF